jgi:hypothetical protein
MNLHRCWLCAYRLLLHLYPPAFRKRFASEMLEVVEADESPQWPLIFADSGVAIVRCWMEGTHSTAVLAEPNGYLSLGGSPVRPLGLLQGFVLSTAIILGVCYVAYHWPPSCSSSVQLLTHVVNPSPAKEHIARQYQSRQNRSPTN